MLIFVTLISVVTGFFIFQKLKNLADFIPVATDQPEQSLTPSEPTEAGLNSDNQNDPLINVNDSASSATDLAAPTLTPAALFSIELTATISNQTAYDLLISQHQVEITQYDFGKFVKSIDGRAGNQEYFWSFYVNGQSATQAADQTVLSAGDRVEFRYEKITSF